MVHRPVIQNSPYASAESSSTSWISGTARARQILKERGELGREVRVEVIRELAADDGTITFQRSERTFARGERVMFLKNDRELGVKNGSLGTVAEVNRNSMRVALDRERHDVTFQIADYAVQIPIGDARVFRALRDI